MMQLQEMVFFITGANRGLGLVFARAALALAAKQVYAAARDRISRSAARGLTHALRNELKAQHTRVLGLHVGFMDTDLTARVNAPEVGPDAARGPSAEPCIYLQPTT
jgi:NAD(P)-dependent dehydrogenase (short-subunit alcohol dehydrogenase family)